MSIRSVWLALPLLALVSACGQAPSGDSHGEPVASDAAPAVSVTAAPGVAFDYRYSFSLPATRIAGAQEGHAASCEKLGIDRCRITGMRYRLLGENRIEAMLAFKLEPSIARAFGKQGITAIEQAEGQLTDAEISGTDAGAEVDRSDTARAGADTELTRIDRQLARSGLPAAERSELQRQRAELVERIATARASVAQARESLANTPMTFEYQSGRAVRGFDAGAPLTSALDLLSGSAQATLAFMLSALALLGPPAIVLLLGWFVWRRFRPHRAGQPAEAARHSD